MVVRAELFSIQLSYLARTAEGCWARQGSAGAWSRRVGKACGLWHCRTVEAEAEAAAGYAVVEGCGGEEDGRWLFTVQRELVSLMFLVRGKMRPMPPPARLCLPSSGTPGPRAAVRKRHALVTTSTLAGSGIGSARASSSADARKAIMPRRGAHCRYLVPGAACAVTHTPAARREEQPSSPAACGESSVSPTCPGRPFSLLRACDGARKTKGVPLF